MAEAKAWRWKSFGCGGGRAEGQFGGKDGVQGESM